MGRKEKQEANSTTRRRLSIKVPSSFRCPISLDVMKSPVSLCTGVTYDRSSIQRWLDAGNTICPATMQPLTSTDLIPNLTLHRLIKLWLPSRVILQDILSSADPVPAINNLLDMIICDDNTVDDDDKCTLVGSAASLLAAKLADQTTTLRVAESVVALVFKILTTFSSQQEQPCRKAMLSALASSSGLLDGTVSSLLLVLKDGTSSDSRKNAAAVLGAVIGNVPPSDGESKVSMAEKPGLLPELVRLASHDGAAVEAALSCLVGLSEVRRARFRMVRLGIVSLSTRILGGQEGAGAAEKALKLLEVAAGCSEGREEICELGERCIGAIVGRIMKVGKEGTESAVVVLWSVCHLFRDRRAQEAVAASGGGGLTKMLLLMQSDCSAAVRRMAGDLLRIFRVNSKSCLSGYDTKATRIMPF